MQYVILTFSIILFSPIAIADTNTTTVFSWLDVNGVMHFSDEKPKAVSDNSITITDVAEPSELGTPDIVVAESNDLEVAPSTETDKNVVALVDDEATDTSVIVDKAE